MAKPWSSIQRKASQAKDHGQTESAASKISFATLRDTFPTMAAENPYANEPYWVLQGVAAVAATQILRHVPDASLTQQEALRALRKAFDIALTVVPNPDREEFERVMARTLAPFQPLPTDVVQSLLRFAELRAGDVLYDLGSGDGRVVIEAARREQVNAVGIEIDRRLCDDADEVAMLLGLGGYATFRNENILDADLSEATVITAFLLTSAMERLRDKLRSLKSGTRILSVAFPIPDWPPHQVCVATGDGPAIYKYIVPER